MLRRLSKARLAPAPQNLEHETSRRAPRTARHCKLGSARLSTGFRLSHSCSSLQGSLSTRTRHRRECTVSPVVPVSLAALGALFSLRIEPSLAPLDIKVCSGRQAAVRCAGEPGHKPMHTQNTEYTHGSKVEKVFVVSKETFQSIAANG